MMGYNFGCVMVSNALFNTIYGLVFGIKLSDEDIAEIEGLRTLP